MADSSKAFGLWCTAVGTLLLGGALACGGSDVSRGASSGVASGAAAAVQGETANAAVPRGRSFTEAEPMEERPDLVTTGQLAKSSGVGGGRGVGLAGLQGSVDPSMLTPEALAKNPLEIGVEKRAPFKLADGADPLDPASYDWVKDKDGHWIISYSDLSLTDVDKETLLDALVYPDEYEGEEVNFPDRIRSLDGEKVALTGYMIAIRWNKDKLAHFMLVRDLKSCCFGQQPEADEWVDVPMNGEGTSYIQFVPVVTRGVFHLAGSSDDAGYAVGAYKIVGDDTREE